MNSVLVSPAKREKWLRRLRVGLLCLALLAGSWKFLEVVHEHYPIQHWLFWRYASYWGLLALMGASCLLGGGATLGLLGLALPRAERWLMSFALGVYLWFVVTFVAGIFGLLGPVFALALPVALTMLGAPRALRRGRRLVPVYRRALRGGFHGSPGSLVLAPLALFGLLLVYVPILTPENVAADSYWYHLTLAQHNAAQGAIARSAEGSFVAAYPQLATTLYTWAFMLPRTAFFDRIEIAAHMEFLLFLWTLVGVGVLARRVVPRRAIGFTWAAIFLFPGLFLYDSNLSVAADHVLAFWGPPIFLALLRAWPRLAPGAAVLLGVTLSGAALTKYQAGTLIAVPVLAIAGRAVFLSLRRTAGGRRLLPVRGALIVGGAALVCTAPHWLKNFIWYGDPFYPMLHARLDVRPWSPDAATYMNAVFADAFWRPSGTLSERLIETGKALFTFSFIPHDWGGFHGKVPVFGSLFTLTTVCLPFVGAGRRLWALAVTTYVGVFAWYWISHQDRYLQALLPWMAAVTGATLVKIWESGLAARVCATALITVQVAWGSDVPFLPTHALINTSPFRKVLDLAATGYQKNYVERLRSFTWWHHIKPKLPTEAKVLIHGDLGPLGLGRPIVSDMIGWQGGISYGRHRSPAELHSMLKSFGVTHVIWLPDWGPRWNSFADDLVFYSFANQHLVDRWAHGSHQVGRLPDHAPTAEPFGLVLYWGSGKSYDSGLYRMDALTVPGYGRHARSEYPAPIRSSSDAATLVDAAAFVVLEANAPSPPSLEAFTLVMHRGDHDLWARRQASE
ncbi:MAG: hypothetical protein IPM35_38545 [Myxococcales bacterium]|nr:hypothetical protein [Myxococcales bacterium]